MSRLSRLAAVMLTTLFLITLVLAVEGDVVFKRKGDDTSTPPAVFPHWKHRILYKCYACHSSLFEMKAGANEITMDTMMAGENCGTCHNDKIAWGVGFDNCTRCHSAE